MIKLRELSKNLKVNNKFHPFKPLCSPLEVDPEIEYDPIRGLYRIPLSDPKAFDHTFGSGSLDFKRNNDLSLGNANVSFLNDMNRGTKYHQRIGNSIYMKELHLALKVVPLYPGQGTATQQYRMAIVFDKQPNIDPEGLEVFPKYSDIFKDSDSGGNSDVNSFPNPANDHRFEILWTWSNFVYGTNNTSQALGNTILQTPEFSAPKIIEAVIPLHRRSTYNSLQTQEPFTRGSLMIVTQGNSTPLSTFVVIGKTRLIFFDE